jgi:hypothetical protein
MSSVFDHEAGNHEGHASRNIVVYLTIQATAGANDVLVVWSLLLFWGGMHTEIAGVKTKRFALRQLFTCVES